MFLVSYSNFAQAQDGRSLSGSSGSVVFRPFSIETVKKQLEVS
jgi:hypothetical protein